MRKPPVIVGLGEVLWDIFPDGARFGGAPANFACHAASLGAESWIASATGLDSDGEKARAFLLEHHVNCGTLSQDPGHSTGRVQVSLHESGNASYQFMANAAWDYLGWSPALASLAVRSDVVCFGTLGQRTATARGTIQRFLAATPAGALKMFDVNIRQDFYSREILSSSLELANAIKLNEDELPILARHFPLRGNDEASLLTSLAEIFDLRLAVLTFGSRGAILSAHGITDQFQPPSVSVVDTVGAGDAYTAAVVTGFLHGIPLADINRHAAAIAGYVCSQRGATPPLPTRLRRLIPSSPTPAT